MKFPKRRMNLKTGPDDLLIRREQEGEFMNLLNQLPPPQRAVLLLHFLEDFPLEEIARITETQLGTVKSRLHYAKRRCENYWRPKMKTPREILLARHRAAEPKLDAIRRKVVAANQTTAELSEQIIAGFRRSQTVVIKICWLLWRELILPSRRIWTGLAAVWLLIFAVNFSERDAVSSVTGKARPFAGGDDELAGPAALDERTVGGSFRAGRRPARKLSPKPRTEKLK